MKELFMESEHYSNSNCPKGFKSSIFKSLKTVYNMEIQIKQLIKEFEEITLESYEGMEELIKNFSNLKI